MSRNQESLDKFNKTKEKQEDEQPKECRYCGRMYAHRSNCPNNEESGY